MTTETMRTHVVLPKDLVEAVDRIVGKRKRSQFIEEAVREVVNRRRRVEAAERVFGSLADVDTPGWETPEAASAWVRESRRRDDERLQEMWSR